MDATALSISVTSQTVSPSRIFWATWAGWMLDGSDGAAYGLLLVSALNELLPLSGIEASKANIAIYGGLGFFRLHARMGLFDVLGAGLAGSPHRPRPYHVHHHPLLFDLHRAVRRGVQELPRFSSSDSWLDLASAANGPPAHRCCTSPFRNRFASGSQAGFTPRRRQELFWRLPRRC